MRKSSTSTSVFLFSTLAILSGCGASRASYVKSDTTLGRIVVYRNGVAYFERSAEVKDDSLKLKVPGDKVDDFLKSLTVVDASTGQPAPVSYPSMNGGNLEMKIHLPGAGPHKVKLSYVTEAPAWKPSYRITVRPDGKLEFQAWAVVDNTSGEDWENVKLGVGSSSAMSFRFDLRGLRMVQRQTLHAEDLFAIAPPVGSASYDQRLKDGSRVLGEFSDVTVAQNVQPSDDGADEKIAMAESAPSHSRGGYAASAPSATQPSGGRAKKPAKMSADYYYGKEGARRGPSNTQEQMQLQNSINVLRSSTNQIVVEGYAAPNDSDKYSQSLDRANKMREELVRNGIDPSRVVAVSKADQPARPNGGVRLVEAAPPKQQVAQPGSKPGESETLEPIGTSHFESGQYLTVEKGSSAMVSIYKGASVGESVYLFDAESSRGNATYPFRAVRFENPTESQLEQGPVSVFGEGRFIGEGLTEPIPAKANAFVPYALDRQLVVEKKDSSREEIHKIITVQRGVFHTEVQHTNRLAYNIHNRSHEKAVMYLRHTVPAGYKVTKSPKFSEKIGNASLYRVELEPNAKTEVLIEEATPIVKTTDIRTPVGLELIKAYVSQHAMEEKGLKTKLEELLVLNTERSNLEERIQTVREQMNEYRTRMDELHAQIVTLKAVKSAGPMMQSLEKKLTEMSDKVSKSTVDLVSLQEKLMLAKVKFQDSVAELSLEKKAVVAEK